jgi:hypothetical protein
MPRLNPCRPVVRRNRPCHPIMTNGCGLSALVSASHYFADEFGLDIEFFGREAFDARDSCKFVMTARWLLFELQIDPGNAAARDESTAV